MESIKTKKIKDYEKFIIENKIKKKQKILHKNLFDNTDYFRLYIFSPSQSGKTSLIEKIVENSIFINADGENDVMLIIVSPSIDSDIKITNIRDRYKNFIDVKIFKKYDNNIQKDIQKLIDDHYNENKDYYNDDDGIYSRIIIIFDDLDDKSMIYASGFFTMLKRQRHKRVSSIISSQYFKEMPLSSRMNQSHFILFSGLSEDFLKLFYRTYIPGKEIPYEKFLEIYNFCTAKNNPNDNKSYNVMFFNNFEKKFRKNLYEKILI